MNLILKDLSKINKYLFNHGRSHWRLPYTKVTWSPAQVVIHRKKTKVMLTKESTVQKTQVTRTMCVLTALTFPHYNIQFTSCWPRTSCTCWLWDQWLICGGLLSFNGALPCWSFLLMHRIVMSFWNKRGHLNSCNPVIIYENSKIIHYIL